MYRITTTDAPMHTQEIIARSSATARVAAWLVGQGVDQDQARRTGEAATAQAFDRMPARQEVYAGVTEQILFVRCTDDPRLNLAELDSGLRARRMPPRLPRSR